MRLTAGQDDAPSSVAFGPFTLHVAQRALVDGQRHVRIGSRALDLLIVLVERAGQTVSRTELIDRVWPSTVVLDANLNVHISALRRALGDDQTERRYIVNVAGRGYRFVAPVRRVDAESSAIAPASRESAGGHGMPALLSRPVGRDQVVCDLVGLYDDARLVSIVGPPGMGKTTTAVQVGNATVGRWRDGIWFVDLAPLSDGTRLPAALARALHAMPSSTDPLEAVLRTLSNRHTLLILDNCEHVIGAVAEVAEALMSAAPALAVLTTSREPLRIRGERVVRLPPLGLPSSDRLSAAQALQFPAIELFVQRAAAGAGKFELDDADVPAALAICRRLDGVPLAIEFAAARVEVFGVAELARRLDADFRVLAGGRRGALPRHRTMEAALEWSVRLLEAFERQVLRGLAVFAGGFGLPAAQEVLAIDRDAHDDVADALESLANRSLLVVEAADGEPRYRLLEVTRAHAAKDLAASAEADELARRHAEYFARTLGEATEAGVAGSHLAARFDREVDNLRSALHWALSDRGDPVIGRRLVVAAIPVWLAMSMLAECRMWMGRAAVGDGVREFTEAMLIQSASRSTEIFTHGATDTSYASWMSKNAVIDPHVPWDAHRVRQLIGPWTFNIRLPDLHQALALANQHAAAAAAIGDPDALSTAEWMLGLTFNHLGDVAKARGHLEAFLLTETPDQRRSFILTTGFDRRSEARVILGENLWLQGLARQALTTVELGVQEAREVGHDLAICEALLWAGFTMHLAGVDVAQVRRLAEEMAQRSKHRSFDSHHALAIALQGLCALRTDRRREGLALLDDALARLQRSRYGPFDPFLIGEAASAMSMNGAGAQALSRIDDFLAVNRNKHMWCLPELLRRRAQVVEACATASDSTMAEEQYRTALAEARGARMAAWELRIAIDLSGLLRRRGNVVEGRSLVAAALAQFTEGWEFDDLRRARHAIQQ